MDGGAWWAAVHWVATSRTRLSDFTFTFHFHALEKEMATHSSVLAWRIPGTGEPGGLPSAGSHRARYDRSDLAAAAAAGSTFRAQASFKSVLVLSPAGILGVPLACLHSSESRMGEWLTGVLLQAVFAQPQWKPHARRMLVLPSAIECITSTNNSNSSVTHSSSSCEPLTLVGELPILRMCPALEEPPRDWAVAAARILQSP